MQEFTFKVLEKNVNNSTLTVEYTPNDTTLQKHRQVVFIPQEAMSSGNTTIIADEIRKIVIGMSPQSLWAQQAFVNSLPSDLDTYLGREDLPPVTLTEIESVLNPPAP